ncbi:hypothetical protein TrVGV298_010234 [Trichoderma virens]|nr:hypothetical protein TrVGV298_010234 [Trichoderma virens]
MATEPSTDNSADVFASTEPQSASDSQHGELVPPAVNGGSPLPEDIANKRILSVEDQINSADVSVSGGSDTEASRAKDGDKGQGRAGSSAKKPATFKAVSVNKTFLASKANPSVSSKTTDKPATGSSTPPTGSATLSISRPRLVAKSGSGTGTSSPRFSSLANGGKPAAAPDPNAVWNKNRPTPVPEPKKFTDEELKKYGIHMASRLNEDDTQGQNKWADIDDDDDDWAPEAITWGDGTKTTLPHPDETSARAADRTPDVIKSATQDKPSSPAPPGATSTPVPKSGGLPSGKGLVLKSAAQEKPVLVAKPPAPPAPAKSPWATLPPVAKTSPGAIESSYPPRGALRESSFASNMGPPPPRDMAVDDYSRSTWRDRSSYGNKELFNSRSGRYEPVPDRRPSMRSDSQTRYPALLQRAPPQDHPAEPSAAFQTSRTAQEGPFGRRRGSSNVSGGSGSYLQRLNKGSDGSIPPPPPEFLNIRRGSLTGSVLESPVSPVAGSVMSQGQSRHQPLPSPGTTYAAPHHGNSHLEHNPAPPSHQLEDDLEYQKKLMREGIESARKRRQEEEAREEAARRERIQKKLEAMGPPPEKKSDAKETSRDHGAKPTPSQQPALSEQTDASTAKANPNQTDSGKDDAAAIPHIEKPGLSHKDIPPQANIAPPPGPTTRRLSHSQDAEPTGATWGSRPDRFSSWVAGTPRNVWSSPDNDSGLGNGTFNPHLGRVSGASTQPTSTNNAPAPIAPPNYSSTSSQPKPSPRSHRGKASPPKHMGVDPASRNALDHTTNQHSTTVSLPVVTVQHSTAASLPVVTAPRSADSSLTLISKPMAEECFEEQEMGSLPRIRLPHKAPEAAWQPASSIKPMPKRFFVQPSVGEPYFFAAEVVGGANAQEADEEPIGRRRDTEAVVTDLVEVEEEVVTAMAAAKGNSLIATEMLRVKAALAVAAVADIVVADLTIGVDFHSLVSRVHHLLS